MNIEKLIEIIKQKALDKTCSDIASEEDYDFNIDDFAGGNIDDAYWKGTDDGEIYFARSLVKLLNEN